MPQTADFILDRLRQWGVHRIFGYPGDGINSLLGALDRADGDPELIQPRHEEMGAFMATAHAKFTGELGCCMATSGGGTIHLLNGLYDAKLDHQPVVAVVGQQKRISLGSAYQQEIDPNTLYKDVSEYVQTCMHPAQARQLIDRACKVALANRTVATVIVPEDVAMEEQQTSPPRVHGGVYTTAGYAASRTIPAQEELRKAADVLNEGQRVAVLVGQGAAKAADEVVEVAEKLGAGVAKTSLGREVLPDDLPYVTGPIGLLGSTASHEMMMNADTLLFVGTSFPYAEWLPPEGQCKGVEIDLDGRMMGVRYPMDAQLIGDSRETLRELSPMLERKQDRSWRERIETEVDEWWRVLDDRAHDSADPLNPELVVHELSQRLPDNSVITTDAGSVANWWARHLKLRRGMSASLSGNLATMGPGTPYAISAKFAYPDRPCIALVGDGAFQMNGMLELITIKRYLDRMNRSPLIFCVFNNGDLNQVTWEQRAMGGERKFPGSQDIPDVPYAEWARLLGFTGIRCDSPDEIGSAWDRALRAEGPVVLEAVVDSEVPPVPPHIKSTQAQKVAQALREGDPQTWGIVAKGAKQKMHEFTESVKSSVRSRER
ncbi:MULTISPECIES: thiamine pyrophosphate-requiring protein [unclassified Actinopolyspora]|uniref:thiamine pyrophosphate-requiring protein n=1 Tax=Actinopolyspora TaxID=1849 RepID=UPI0013F60AB6|nr:MULTISPECIES: thiamine pyrophosphate-requiring protein [unclassified Actinopolyspora]NHD19497.1 thiamine pyrophosphate-requiring protein [Actinopolyspora sp. BKK2]NHE77437.1 thiamine pyrophosphate-requiring protein [Actinopolyspora sp. BKK1]